MPLPDKHHQIVLAHAGLIHAVVAATQNRDHHAALGPLLKMAEGNGWSALVRVVRAILRGAREPSLLSGLEEEDQVIAGAILRGLQDPTTLPDPQAGPEPAAAAPGLAALIHAAGTGDAGALAALGQMAEQMLQAGGDMARLSAVLRRLVNGERDSEQLSRSMGPHGKQLMTSIIEELGKLGLQ